MNIISRDIWLVQTTHNRQFRISPISLRRKIKEASGINTQVLEPPVQTPQEIKKVFSVDILPVLFKKRKPLVVINTRDLGDDHVGEFIGALAGLEKLPNNKSRIVIFERGCDPAEDLFPRFQEAEDMGFAVFAGSHTELIEKLSKLIKP